MNLLGLWHYWLFALLLVLGLYGVISRSHLVKKMMALNLFQVAAITFFVTMGKVDGGTAPIVALGVENPLYSNPLPHVLMLTAIVVGIATTALGLSLTVRIKEAYGTLDEDEIRELDARQPDAPLPAEPEVARLAQALPEGTGARPAPEGPA